MTSNIKCQRTSEDTESNSLSDDMCLQLEGLNQRSFLKGADILRNLIACTGEYPSD